MYQEPTIGAMLKIIEKIRRKKIRNVGFLIYIRVCALGTVVLNNLYMVVAILVSSTYIF